MAPTHIAKVIVVNGRKRTVYVRTAETHREMERLRMGPLADLRPIDTGEFRPLLRKSVAVFQADYEIARRVIRTRIGLDRSPHRVMSGTMLIGEYFHLNESFRSGLPHLKQLFIMFGYMEIGNRMLHQILCEMMFLRYEAGNHIWLMIPKDLGEMAETWGEAFQSFRIFPFLHLPIKSQHGEFTPISTANPLAQPTPSPLKSKWHADPSYPEQGGDLGPESLTAGDLKFAPIEKKKKRWNP